MSLVNYHQTYLITIFVLIVIIQLGSEYGINLTLKILIRFKGSFKKLKILYLQQK